MCVCVGGEASHVPVAPRGITSLGTGVRDNCEVSNMGSGESNSGTLQDQEVS